MATRKKKNTTLRDLTAEESISIIKKYVEEENDVLNFKNHRKHPLLENTFRFTLDLISLELIIQLMEDDQIKNIYFNPSIPPPGGSIDSISLRYKVYVQYHMKEE